MSDHDPVNKPAHYLAHPSGVECITITRHFNFALGNAVKYIWRAGLKGNDGAGITFIRTDTGKMHNSATDKQIEDLRKAAFYINDEIARLGGANE